MTANKKFLFLFFLSFFSFVLASEKNAKNNLIVSFNEKLDRIMSYYAGSFAKSLEHFNDERMLDTDIGRMIGYKEIKPKLENNGRGMKKMGMAMLPIIFHVGATSTWMILTSLLAAKSVAIGLALLVFKIAVSSAKVASYFTEWKKESHHHHNPWEIAHHHDHFDHHHDADFVVMGPSQIPQHEEYHSLPPHDYNPGYQPIEWSPPSHSSHRSIPSTFKSDHYLNSLGDYGYSSVEEEPEKNNVNKHSYS